MKRKKESVWDLAWVLSRMSISQTPPHPLPSSDIPDPPPFRLDAIFPIPNQQKTGDTKKTQQWHAEPPSVLMTAFQQPSTFSTGLQKPMKSHGQHSWGAFNITAVAHAVLQ